MDTNLAPVASDAPGKGSLYATSDALSHRYLLDITDNTVWDQGYGPGLPSVHRHLRSLPEGGLIMAKNETRSMNADLRQGAEVDGKRKSPAPDRGGAVEAQSQKYSLSEAYYGQGVS